MFCKTVKSTLMSRRSLPMRLMDSIPKFPRNKSRSSCDILLYFPSNNLKLFSGKKILNGRKFMKLLLIVNSCKLMRSAKVSLEMFSISVSSTQSTSSFVIPAKLLRLKALKGVCRTSISNKFGKIPPKPFGKYFDHR